MKRRGAYDHGVRDEHGGHQKRSFHDLGQPREVRKGNNRLRPAFEVNESVE